MKMISIKESFRISGTINKLMSELQSYIMLNTRELAYDIKENHYKSKQNSDVSDELDVIPSNIRQDEYGLTLKELIEVYDELIKEKANLQRVTILAKNKLTINYEEDEWSIDALLDRNKSLRSEAEVLQRFMPAKELTSKSNGRDYKFNVEGNQVPYSYEIETIQTLKINKDEISEKYRNLVSVADEISDLVDEVSSSKVIEYNGIITPYHKLSDYIRVFKEKSK